MSGEPDFTVPPAFAGPATVLNLRPTGDYQSFPNGDGTQHFVDAQREWEPVVLIWQYGKVWVGRVIELEETMPTQKEAETALGIIWGKLEAIKVEAVRLREASIAIKAMADAIEQAAWDAENQFHDVKVALGLE